MKKVCVTGGSGFIGSHFIKLIEQKYEVYNYDSKEGYDIRGMLPYTEFDYIVHFAAMRSVSEGEKYPKDYIEVNCWGTMNMLVRNPKARFINISSSSVNDVRSVYGATKQFSESVVSMRPNNLNIRLYNVFGEGQPMDSNSVIVNFIKCRRDGEIATIYGDGTQSRDFTYVGDVVESIKHVMESNQTGTVHFGYGTSISIKELFNLICFCKKEYISKPMRSFEITHSKSPTKMPVVKYGRKRGLKRTLKWYDDARARVCIEG